MSAEHWGPWTEHVPGPCPVPVGTWVEAICAAPFGGTNTGEGRIVPGSGPLGVDHISWWATMDHPTHWPVLRYRVRIDREHSGMSVLRELLNGIPVKETEDA